MTVTGFPVGVIPQPLTPLGRVPEMFAMPAATPVAKPVLLMVATPVLFEVHVSALVTVLEPAVAVNCAFCPTGMVVPVAGGLTVTEVTAVPVTVAFDLPSILFAIADTTGDPCARANPTLPFMQSEVGEEDVQFAWLVTSCPLHEAVNCCTWPVVRLGDDGDTVTVVQLDALGKNQSQPVSKQPDSSKVNSPSSNFMSTPYRLRSCLQEYKLPGEMEPVRKGNSGSDRDRGWALSCGDGRQVREPARGNRKFLDAPRRISDVEEIS